MGVVSATGAAKFDGRRHRTFLLIPLLALGTMKGKLTLLALALLSILAAVAVSPSRAVGNVPQAATGSGQLEFTTDGVTALRTFAFEATKASDGSVTGEAQINNRSVPGRLHIQIDCLNVIGNIAVVSGTITSSTEAGVPAGASSIFGVQDNGEGAGGAPDRITQQFANSGLVCTDITPSNVGLFTHFLMDVEAGNIQVH
jgi:hypothetical protein